MVNSKIRVLYVDDEPFNLDIFKLTFKEKYEVHTALTAMDGLKLAAELEFPAIISDLKMPEMNGIQFLECVKAICPNSMRIIVTGMLDDSRVDKALDEGLINSFIHKPWAKLEVIKVLDQAAS
ncbi:MAG TPA: response regulator [Blastocatellia bacterium]|nr:response regulator [Blastocatellia bacterium]